MIVVCFFSFFYFSNLFFSLSASGYLFHALLRALFLFKLKHLNWYLKKKQQFPSNYQLKFNHNNKKKKTTHNNRRNRMNKLKGDGKMKTTATTMAATMKKKRTDSDLIKLDTTIIKIYFDTLTLCVKFWVIFISIFLVFGFNFYWKFLRLNRELFRYPSRPVYIIIMIIIIKNRAYTLRRLLANFLPFLRSAKHWIMKYFYVFFPLHSPCTFGPTSFIAWIICC